MLVFFDFGCRTVFISHAQRKKHIYFGPHSSDIMCTVREDTIYGNLFMNSRPYANMPNTNKKKKQHKLPEWTICGAAIKISSFFFFWVAYNYNQKYSSLGHLQTRLRGSFIKLL